MTVFVREYLGKTLGRELGYRVCPPEGFANPPNAAARKNYGWIRSSLQHWQAYLRKRKRSRYVDVHNLLPQYRVVLFDRIPFAKNAGVVDKAIQPAKLFG